MPRKLVIAVRLFANLLLSILVAQIANDLQLLVLPILPNLANPGYYGFFADLTLMFVGLTLRDVANEASRVT